MITVHSKGDFSKAKKYLFAVKEKVKVSDLERFGEEGVAALSRATPVDSGKTASSWYYEIERTKNTSTISFFNSNIQNGVPIAILLEYGHGTRNGGYVQGREYINASIQPVFDKIAEEAWKEVMGL